MAKKTGWEESSTGPDWIDVEGMMRAISALHSGRVEVILRPLGTGFGTGVCAECRMSFDVLPGSNLPAQVTVEKSWPCDKHQRLVAHVFSLMYELDFAISKVYKQESLFG